jgi:predicted enzyme related to lactoylglutathione lyase
VANTFDWVEIHATDVARSARFYLELFAWKLLERDSADGLEVLIFDTGAAPRLENLRRGGIWQRPAGERLGIVVYVVVDSLDATVARAVQLGGKVVAPKTPQGRNFRACIADPDGNILGIWEESPHARETA